MKNIIAVIFCIAIISSLGYWLFQENQTKNYEETLAPVYSMYQVLIDNGNKLTDDIIGVGRNFDNLFSDLNDLKISKQDLKIKDSQISRANVPSLPLNQQLKSAFDAQDEALKAFIAMIEQQRNYQIKSIDKESQDFKDAENSYKDSIKKQIIASDKSREEQEKLQAIISTAIDKYLVDPRQDTQESQ